MDHGDKVTMIRSHSLTPSCNRSSCVQTSLNTSSGRAARLTSDQHKLFRPPATSHYLNKAAQIIQISDAAAVRRDERVQRKRAYGDERRTQIVASEGDFSAEDLIPDQDVVVTITRTGYAKRTNADLYKTQRRGGRGVKGAALKQDDVVDHFFVASTHDWLLFFTNQGRVYRAKVHELPDAGRDARGQHVANLMAFKSNETIAQVLSFKDYKRNN